MFSYRRPTQSEIDRFLIGAENQKFSYSEIGTTAGLIPTGYTVDRNRTRLGSGAESFRNAKQSLEAWKMFELGWVHLFPLNTPIQIDETVALVVRHFGFWSLNACRIVYVIKEERQFGFAYGTLEQHAEQGEERFSVEWDFNDDSVFYNILAFSKPRQWQAKTARPLSRLLQKRFARDSMAAMRANAPPQRV